MDSAFWSALGTSSSAALVTSIGIYTIRNFAEWGKRNTTYFMYFAAGVLISASFLHIIPKSLEMNTQASMYLLLGYFGLYFFDRFLTAFTCQKEPETNHCHIGLISMIGIGFHSFLDGFVYSISFTVSIFTGFLTTTGMVLHEFPEGIITYLLLLKGGFRERNALILAFLAAACTTPLGMLVSYPIMGVLKGSVLGALLSLSAGTLVYVGATHLLPKAEQEQQEFSIVALGGGILVAALIVLSKT